MKKKSRTSRRNMRKILDSFTNNSRERFYENLQPVAWICKIFGYFSLQNCYQRDGGKLKYKIFSLHTYYGAVFIIILILLLMSIDIDFIRIGIITFYATEGVTSIILNTYYDRHLPTLIQKIEEFEISMRHFKNIHKRIINSNKNMRYLGLSGCAAYFTYPLLRFILSKDAPVHRVRVYIITILTRSRCFYLIFYIMFCYIIKQHFFNLKYIFKGTMTNILQDQQNNIFCMKLVCEHEIEKYRLLHAKLLKILEHFNVCYGPRMAFALLSIILESLIDFYVVFFTSGKSTFPMIYSIFNAISLYVITISADSL
ncbi:hypothetical protein L9F63_014768, partial [Diploptera punctata]